MTDQTSRPDPINPRTAGMRVRAVFSTLPGLAALAGMLPFCAGLFYTLFPALLPIEALVFERALLGYGALILAFVGGVRWGVALNGPGGKFTYLFGILGSVLGFVALLLPFFTALLVLIAGFVLHGVWDVLASLRGRLPRSYGLLRAVMTALVAVLLGLTAFVVWL